jgi:hypothetical protein
VPPTIAFDEAEWLTGDEAQKAAAVTANRCCLCRDGKPGNLADFLRGFAQKGHTYDDDSRGAESQYWLTLEDGVVVAIDEQYVLWP